jgi:decaprenylphospho-beta-D-erythro-pentofuranosid-2-ulose 2-reductase
MIVIPRSHRGTVLILGATSSIARHTAAAFASRGYDLCLAARDQGEVQRVTSDLALRHRVNVQAVHFDAANPASISKMMDVVMDEAFGDLSGVVLCFGTLGVQEEAQDDAQVARDIIGVNFTAAVGLLTPLANHFEERGRGFIATISSVAGDRGRQSNYVYGSAKGGLSIFLQGLRQRLAKSGVTVTTIKPGFVDTRMTFGLPGMFLVANPADVGEGIARAIEKGKSVAYIPWFWRWIMLIIKLIPERIFVKLKL